MLGLLINKMEQKELEYLLKRELEELLMDLEDPRIDPMIKKAMRNRYITIFQLLRRVVPEGEYLKYVLKTTKVIDDTK